MEQEEKVIAYKGFNKDLTCKGFQYEIGKEYEEKEEIKVCTNGFHACENPFDVLDFYGNICNNRFCKVEQSGVIQKKRKKQASSKIKVLKEIGLAGLFEAGIGWINKITNPATIIKESERTNDGNIIGSSGYYAKIASSKDCVKIGSSGDSTCIGSSGYYAKMASSGDSTCIGSSGYYAKMASSGDFVKMASSGTRAKISSSGNNAYIGSIGGCAKIGSSGDIVQIVSSGECAQIGSSGDYAKIESIGEDSIVCCAGINSTVKAKKGSWITLSEWQYSQEKKRFVPICVKTEHVDGERIKEDVWYRLKDGEFVEYSPKEE